MCPTQVSRQPFYSFFESALLACLHLRIIQISTNGETMRAVLPIYSLVSWSKRLQDLVALDLSLRCEEVVVGAAVDE